MILIGQYDSPFVRRVGITLRLYGIAFDHRPLSAFSDTAALAALNPLLRVPALVLPDGFVLTDSHMILDYLDGMRRCCPGTNPHDFARCRSWRWPAVLRKKPSVCFTNSGCTMWCHRSLISAAANRSPPRWQRLTPILPHDARRSGWGLRSATPILQPPARGDLLAKHIRTCCMLGGIRRWPICAHGLNRCQCLAKSRKGFAPLSKPLTRRHPLSGFLRKPSKPLAISTLYTQSIRRCDLRPRRCPP